LKDADLGTVPPTVVEGVFSATPVAKTSLDVVCTTNVWDFIGKPIVSDVNFCDGIDIVISIDAFCPESRGVTRGFES